VTVSGVVALVFTIVLGRWPGTVAGAVMLLALAGSWWLLPRRLRSELPAEDAGQPR
jgi:hypothetical protein